MVVTCGSVTVEVLSGAVGITFVAEVPSATTSLAAGNELTFESTTLTVTAPTTNIQTVVLLIAGRQLPLDPGATATIQTDTTPPVITPFVTGTLGNNGWYTSDVTISWNVVEPDSTIQSTTGCDPVTLTADTAGTSFTCAATSAGGSASGSVTIKRDATPPDIAITSPTAFAVAEVGTLGADIQFTANDALSGLESDSPSALLNDGTTEVSVNSGDIPIPGVYTLTVTATDLAGNQSTASRIFVIYNPANGFATGGGWIIPGGGNSNPGDDLPGIDGSSKATFGFVVKYKKGASNPSGQLEFQYHTGDFNLHSVDYNWLVVTNSNWAKFQGLATINGMSGLFPFRVDARDGDANNGALDDRFIIKIWPPGSNPDLDELVYKASGNLGGGKIIIHE